jgi:hypothetical protein
LYQVILLELPFSFRFAILVSGFRSRLSPHAHFYETKQNVATLHIIGETDRIVEKGKLFVLQYNLVKLDV